MFSKKKSIIPSHPSQDIFLGCQVKKNQQIFTSHSLYTKLINSHTYFFFYFNKIIKDNLLTRRTFPQKAKCECPRSSDRPFPAAPPPPYADTGFIYPSDSFPEQGVALRDLPPPPEHLGYTHFCIFIKKI